MSRTAITVLVRHLLRHQPTPEEYEDTRKLLLELCPGGRLHIPSNEALDMQPDLLNDVRDMKRNGFSIRHIAREKKLSKSTVQRILAESCPKSGGAVGQTPEETVS